MVATIKVRNFFAVKDVLEFFGVEPAAALKNVGLDPNLFANRETVVLYSDAGRLLAECARLTDRDDFGFRAGQREDATAMGLTGLLSLHAMKVGEALGYIAVGLRASDTGGVFSFEARGGVASLSYAVIETGVERPEQIVDAAMAIACNTLRQFCGPGWSPERVFLPRGTPRDFRCYRQFFGAPVEFEAPAARMVCDASVLDRQIVTHNPHYIDILTPLFDAALAGARGDLILTVKAVLKAQVGGGRLTRARVAQAMGMSEHVLVARLAEADATFSDLAEEVKFELARQMLASGREQRAIAGELGFADASAFNRAFVKWSGQTPGRWRAGRMRSEETQG
ncbi:AraC family transcriptional regulator [Rhodoblastus acidophilus]|uniref:AraC family transcriptional regulator n=1 Tax=Candidatus Rhodoblastus alkanivorans TaxID=2954117 RepID=A0ABS9Z7M4_9HYPH|nr:AraC family transcriptional regulator [Candidatus Rhodoblastus alkanivorans]MCI4678631.1 AraC family transcriptional regulator [Candidatus Rhodoblastus alkanivorans]MCI4683041.1 AraC family transcriptional regulator [Candidatus Rhodoblastus alkanivorans]MDI4640351.1 AraC family transcriptional regulator [Rhodoblastus acidophilus]